MNTHAADTFIFDFQTLTNADAWQIVSDDVMGDVSTSDFRLTNGTAVFQGVLSLANNGGFASVRSLPSSHELRVENKGDGVVWDFIYQKHQIVVTPARTKSGWRWFETSGWRQCRKMVKAEDFFENGK
jgi:hypothetical protein